MAIKVEDENPTGTTYASGRIVGQHFKRKKGDLTTPIQHLAALDYSNETPKVVS